jgi:pimeloyl-ACP methyl ester carboxylesterase
LRFTDAILEFAQQKLGFALGEIILLGWSIGGYATSWAAMNHPGIRGVLLDAPFDDLAPLAERIVPAMLPPYFLPFSEVVLRRHYNLNVTEQLRNYAGPLVVVRRMQDEVISGGRPQDLSQNRTNDLLRKFLVCRYGAADWGALPSTYPTPDAWIDGWLGAPVSAADGTSVQKDALIKALKLKASTEAVVRPQLPPPTPGDHF